MDKAVDIELIAAAQRLLYQLQVDDIAFFGICVFLGVCYSLRRILYEKPDPHHHLWFEKPQGADADSKEANTRDIGLKLEQTVSRSNLQ
jgi:NADPH-ferrihemoprotein reductase